MTADAFFMPGVIRVFLFLLKGGKHHGWTHQRHNR